MRRNTPVKYYPWIERDPERHQEPDNENGHPLIALAVCLVLLGGVFGFLALIG